MTVPPALDGLRIREAVRALVVSDDRHVLLVRFEFATATVWAPPGGGLEPGETHATALVRELEEETGLVDAPIGPHVWNRVHVIPFEDGSWDGQRERFHLVTVGERFEPRPRLSWDELRAEKVHELRWLPVDEIADLARPGAERPVLVRPDGLGPRLADLLQHGPPPEPLDVPV